MSRARSIQQAVDCFLADGDAMLQGQQQLLSMMTTPSPLPLVAASGDGLDGSDAQFTHPPDADPTEDIMPRVTIGAPVDVQLGLEEGVGGDKDGDLPQTEVEIETEAITALPGLADTGPVLPLRAKDTEEEEGEERAAASSLPSMVLALTQVSCLLLQHHAEGRERIANEESDERTLCLDVLRLQEGYAARGTSGARPSNARTPVRDRSPEASAGDRQSSSSPLHEQHASQLRDKSFSKASAFSTDSPLGERRALSPRQREREQCLAAIWSTPSSRFLSPEQLHQLLRLLSHQRGERRHLHREQPHSSSVHMSSSSKDASSIRRSEASASVSGHANASGIQSANQSEANVNRSNESPPVQTHSSHWRSIPDTVTSSPSSLHATHIQRQTTPQRRSQPSGSARALLSPNSSSGSASEIDSVLLAASVARILKRSVKKVSA